MEGVPPKELARSEVRSELQASLAARRELDSEMEEHLVTSFLARIEQQIDARVEARVGEIRDEVRASRAPVMPQHDEGIEVAIVAGSFALAIPLMVIAGIFMQGTGVIAVMAGLVLVNALYFAARMERQRG